MLHFLHIYVYMSILCNCQSGNLDILVEINTLRMFCAELTMS